VLFFVSVGMLFDPGFPLREPVLLLAVLGVILIAKPLAALGTVAALGYTTRTGLTAAFGLAQVGEFSFILGELARHHGLLPDAGANVLVAAALVSISINPLLFGRLDAVESWLRARPRLWRLLNARAERRRDRVNAVAIRAVEARPPAAVIVGYGPVGRTVDRLIRQAGMATVVIDLNLDTVSALAQEGRAALYGDASHADILRHAGIARASHLVVTLPHKVNRGPLIAAARQQNPALQILVRARYLRERGELEQAGANAACYEEAEAAVALARRVLQDIGRDEAAIALESERIRRELAAESS
jgi:CPA2 family monovalent cation:H+ antiporter-2